MSTTTISARGSRVRTFAIVAAVLAAVVAAVLAVVDAADISRAVPASEASVPMPEWLDRYLAYESPAEHTVPAPEWLERYSAYEAPSGAATEVAQPAGSTRPVNRGLF